MDIKTSVAALSALGHETRIAIFRLLVKVGPEGLLAGEVGRRLGVRQNTLSSNLAILHRAALIRSEREGRAIRYFADMDGTRALLAFLLEDCCGGRRELCEPLIDEIACAC